ncbi:MAG TPA: cytochrome c oxidase assembly protein [Egibacteraceae bacterium]|nr:cytochrome c oxidase assembly protein [Egibacteraceae bacterium]
MSPADPLRWQPHPDAWLLGILLLGGYFYALAAWGPRLAPGRTPASRRHKQAFVAGVLTLWIASDYPIHGLSEHLFSAHMLQHTIYSLVSAPLLILGVPGWLWRRLLSPAPVRAVWRTATRPLVALAIFNGWIAVYHAPFMVNASVHSEIAHFAMHIAWVLASLVMWWPVLSPLPELPHLSPTGRMLFLFAQSIVPTVPASFLTFSHAPIYAAYDTATRAFGLSAIDDQQIAGLLMKIGGGFLIWGVITVLFFRWATQERTGGPDPLYWRDLEAGLEPAGQGAR